MTYLIRLFKLKKSKFQSLTDLESELENDTNLAQTLLSEAEGLAAEINNLSGRSDELSVQRKVLSIQDKILKNRGINKNSNLERQTKMEIEALYYNLKADLIERAQSLQFESDEQSLQFESDDYKKYRM